MLLNSRNSKRALWRLVLLWLALGAVLLPAAHAQAPAQTPPKIRRIEIKFTSAATVTEEIVRSNMALREGMAYDEAAIDRDIHSLYNTQLFEFIEIIPTQVSNTEVDLVVELRPRMRLGAVRFEGNRKVSTRRLEDELTIRQNPILNESQVKSDRDKILEYYRKAGFSQARVEYVIDRNPMTNIASVIFQIDEGNKIRIKRIEFVGNKEIRGSALRKQMQVARWAWWSWLTGSGKYDDKKFDEDLDKLRDFYRERGFLDIEIDVNKITFSYPSPKTMTITIPVQEGKQYRVGDVSVSGNKLFPSDLLVRVSRVRKGDVFAPTKLDEEVERMENFYGQFGFLDTRVFLVRKPNTNTGAIDIEYEIQESEKFIVESINIEGNTKTKSIVVLRELLLAPGDVFDSVRMETSRLRLENTRFFEDISVTDRSTNIPGRKNLEIRFSEGRTGNLTFGAGYSSLEKAVIFIELTQANFDLFNRRSFFQGDGQKFRIKAQLGSSSSEYVLAFEEPWLFEQELGLGFQIYHQRSDYTSSIYDELRQGFEVYLRKRLFERVEGRFSYRLENVEIFNIDPSLGNVFEGFSGKTTVSKFGLTIARDTRNSLLTPTRGSNIQGIAEIAGGPLGGDVNYYRLEGRYSHYFPIFEFQNQVIELRLHGGVLQEFGDSGDVPFYDRFFLGGQNDMRGFEFREVGPKNSFGEPIGGKTYGHLSLEYSLDIVAPIRFAIFYDGGFVNKGSFDFNPSRYNDNFGFGVRFFVLGQPLRLDYGIPLTTDAQNDEGAQFNFTFNNRF